MLFFTPELYARFNSSDEREADEADEAWERASVRYRKHLDGIRDRMPSAVRKLADLCLHDVELLAFDQAVEPAFLTPHAPTAPFPYWSATAVLSVRSESGIATLFYVLWDRTREVPSPEDWPFSKEHVHWLYDEIDTHAGQPGLFLHRILFSDGRVVEIPFMSVIVHNIFLVSVEKSDMARQSANATGNTWNGRRLLPPPPTS